MKILRAIRSVNPEGGGPVESLKQSTELLQNMGHDIEILSLDSGRADFVKQFPFPLHTPGEGKGTYGYSRPFKHWLAQHYSDYDAVIVQGLWQYHGFAVYSTLKQTDTPYYVFTHGMLDPWFKHQYPLKHLKKSLYWPWGEYQILKNARKVLFTCEQERVLARQSFKKYDCTEQVVNYGTAGHTGDSATQCEQFYARFPALKKQRFLLFLSRIHPKKGVDLLISAFKAIADKDPDLKLVIAGPDQVGSQHALEKQAEALGIRDRIIWTGMLKGDLKWGAYLAAEAFILPSHQENFGIVVAEALSCKRPVLISDKVNIWREIAQNQAGLVAEDTLAGTQQLLNQWRRLSESEKSRMRDNARQCFEKHFEINAAADSLIQAISE